MIKAIIFDLGNVFINYDLAKAASEFSKECHVSILKVWFHFLTSSAEKEYARGEISSRAFYERARRAIGFQLGYRKFCLLWNSIFWENAGMEALLVELKKKYPLYLITNTNSLHYEHVKKKYKLLRHFRKRFASHEMGCRKPEPLIYRKVLAAIQLRPEETIFIDDNPLFVQGAKKVGMQALWFKKRKTLIRDLKRVGVLRKNFSEK